MDGNHGTVYQLYFLKYCLNNEFKKYTDTYHNLKKIII